VEARDATSAAQACTTVVPRGLEPRTLRLLAVRSNQLSYETRCVYHWVVWCVVCVVCCLASVSWLVGWLGRRGLWAHKLRFAQICGRPCGLMDKALVFGTKDCRFESCQGHALYIVAFVRSCFSLAPWPL
jgi:hypothetical protein